MKSENNIVIFNRLEAVATQYFGSLKSLAEKLHITSQAIYQWRKKGIPFKKYEKLANIGINPEYIKYGNEPMILDGESEPNLNTAMDILNGSLSDIINQFNLRNTTINEMEIIKKAMLNKITEIDEYLKIEAVHAK